MSRTLPLLLLLVPACQGARSGPEEHDPRRGAFRHPRVWTAEERALLDLVSLIAPARAPGESMHPAEAPPDPTPSARDPFEDLREWRLRSLPTKLDCVYPAFLLPSAEPFAWRRKRTERAHAAWLIEHETANMPQSSSSNSGR